MKASHERVSVTGFVHCRPRRSWDPMRLPFSHVWIIKDGKLTRFESLLDNIELRPLVAGPSH